MINAQVAALLERLARSTFPPYHELPPAVARRLYRETRAHVQTPPPVVQSTALKLAPGSAGPVPLRIYRPLGSKPEDFLPALVFFHGGGWTIGDLDTHDVLCRALSNEAHCAVLSVEYRVAPEASFPAAVDDAFAALQFAFKSAASLGIDAARVAVGGDSAGGNLAAVAAILARDANLPPLALQLLLYPATDQRMCHASIDRNGEGYLLTKQTMRYFRGNYLPDKSTYTDWRASPLLAPALAGVAPAHIVTAGYDPLCDEGAAYAERLEREGVVSRCVEYGDMVHGFMTMNRVLDAADLAVRDCALALRNAFERAASTDRAPLARARQHERAGSA